MKKKQEPRVIPPLRKKTAQERLAAGLPIEPDSLTAALNWDNMMGTGDYVDGIQPVGKELEQQEESAG